MPPVGTSEGQPDRDAAGVGEFAPLAEACAELGLDPAAIPPVARQEVNIGHDQDVSVLVWGQTPSEIVFLHGGGQNAHTWDLVALMLGRPAIAIDLPGHGHSSWRQDRDYGPRSNALAAAAAIESLAPDARVVVGMSLGGMTAIRLASTRPELVRRAVLVDVTPGSAKASQDMTSGQRGAVELTRGPRTFASIEDMIQAAVLASPRRPASAVRRGVAHNSRQLPDGTWAWRYDVPDGLAPQEVESLWDDLTRLTMPTMLVRGGESAFVTDADLAEVTRRLPTIRVEVVPDSGHAVQSDQPAALTRLIEEFVFA
jgi:pimeloyl-ACP methyl ester carboxylesterase